MIHPRHDARHPVLGLGEQRHHQVRLVVAGGSDHHLAPLQRRIVQRADLAGIGQQPFRPGDAVHLDRLRRMVDQQHLVPVLKQLARNGPADSPGSRYRYPHQCSPPRAAKAAAIRSRSASLATTGSPPPSCSTVPGSGTNAWPSRSTKVILVIVLASSALTCSPIQRGEKAISASTILPVGSRQSGSPPSGSSLRSIWSAVQRTVATAGMPRRS